LRKLQPFQISKEGNLPKIKSLHHVQQVRNPLRNLQPFQSCKKRNLPNQKLYTTYNRQASPLETFFSHLKAAEKGNCCK
jgi:hypothetical protein